jgi:hypothetical protein
MIGNGIIRFFIHMKHFFQRNKFVPKIIKIVDLNASHLYHNFIFLSLTYFGYKDNIEQKFLYVGFPSPCFIFFAVHGFYTQIFFKIFFWCFYLLNEVTNQ